MLDILGIKISGIHRLRSNYAQEKYRKLREKGKQDRIEKQTGWLASLSQPVCFLLYFKLPDLVRIALTDSGKIILNVSGVGWFCTRCKTISAGFFDRAE